MSFINWKVKESTRKCAECRFNLSGVTIDQKGYMHYLNLDEKVRVTARAAMWASCKVCPTRKDFVKIYGVEPIEYFGLAMN